MRAQARCDTDTSVISSWSKVKSVTINQIVPCDLSVQVPEGGDLWCKGETMTIQWSYTGDCGSTVAIRLYKGTSLLFNITSSTSNDGSYPWVIPGTLENGSDYRVNILDLSSGDRQSTGNFTIETCEDCVGFNPNNIQVVYTGGKWVIADGGHYIISFDVESEAWRSYDIIKFYDMDEICFVGRPDASMTYWKVNGEAPTGYYSGEDCISINPNNLSYYQSGSLWILTDGNSQMLAFPNESEAAIAKDIIETYGFTRQCFVGRPNASMEYFRK